MINQVQFECLDGDAPRVIPMSEDGEYFFGKVEGGTRMVVERLAVVVLDAPAVSTGTISIGTNDVVDNVLAPIPWSMVALGVPPSGNYPALVGAIRAESVGPDSRLRLKVTRGPSDEGGKARVILFALTYPWEI